MKKTILSLVLTFTAVNAMAEKELQFAVKCSPGVVAVANIPLQVLPVIGLPLNFVHDILDGHIDQTQDQVEDALYGIIGRGFQDLTLKIAGDDSDSEVDASVERIVSMEQLMNFRPCKNGGDKWFDANEE